MKDPAESAGQELESFPSTGCSCLCVAAGFHQKRDAAKRSKSQFSSKGFLVSRCWPLSDTKHIYFLGAGFL